MFKTTKRALMHRRVMAHRLAAHNQGPLGGVIEELRTIGLLCDNRRRRFRHAALQPMSTTTPRSTRATSGGAPLLFLVGQDDEGTGLRATLKGDARTIREPARPLFTYAATKRRGRRS